MGTCGTQPRGPGRGSRSSPARPRRAWSAASPCAPDLLGWRPEATAAGRALPPTTGWFRWTASTAAARHGARPSEPARRRARSQGRAGAELHRCQEGQPAMLADLLQVALKIRGIHRQWQSHEACFDAVAAQSGVSEQRRCPPGRRSTAVFRSPGARPVGHPRSDGAGQGVPQCGLRQSLPLRASCPFPSV